MYDSAFPCVARALARPFIVPLAALGLSAAAQAAPAVYAQVQPGAQVDFQATQMGVAMKGHFGTVHAQVHFTPQDPKTNSVQVSVDTASVDAGSGQTNELLRGADWLDAKADPQARFVSSAWSAAGPGRYWVDGQFTVRGVTHPLRVLVSTHAQGQALAMDADFKLQRGIWGLGSGSWADTSVVAADIPVHVHLVVAP
ncbi:YceI family protein [Thiomonas sp. FB-6]|uniref:YceI family protein n=1 Tax=Thiomonas sp. FB-6 TaxID=1158291 RepID=UPI00036B57ED|nr:YceI family protein [Thiomonas sp. FB-6]